MKAIFKAVNTMLKHVPHGIGTDILGPFVSQVRQHARIRHVTVAGDQEPVLDNSDIVAVILKCRRCKWFAPSLTIIIEVVR